jgi:ribosome-associated protein
MDIRKLQRAIVDGLEDVKAQDIVVFNTEALTPLFERVIIASGSSNRQTKALASSVRETVKSRGMEVLRMEGEDNGEWIIVDCGAAVVHVMQPSIREYYHLEEIWGAKPVAMKRAAKAQGLVKASEPAAPPARKPASKSPARAPAKSPVRAPARSPAKPAAKTAAQSVPKAPARTAAKTATGRRAAVKTTAQPVAKSAGRAPAKVAAKPPTSTVVVARKTPARKAAPARKAPAAKPAAPRPAARAAAPARKAAAPARKAAARKTGSGKG